MVTFSPVSLLLSRDKRYHFLYPKKSHSSFVSASMPPKVADAREQVLSEADKSLAEAPKGNRRTTISAAEKKLLRRWGCLPACLPACLRRNDAKTMLGGLQ
jgi:hypothetical protein